MTVAAGAATMFWFSKLQSAIQTQTEAQVSQMVGQMAMQIKILSAQYDSKNQNLSIVLSNIGTVPIKKSQLVIAIDEQNIVNGTTKRCYVGSGSEWNSSYNDMIPVGKIVTIWNSTETCDFKPYEQGYQYIITVTLPNGFTDTYTLRP